MFLLPLVFALEVPSSSFKILQLTDLHYGEGDTQDRLNAGIQENLIRWEHPDLVVITGDIVSGYAWPGTEGWYATSYYKFIKPMQDAGVPWALILGNHDYEADLTGSEILDMDIKQPLSLSTHSLSSLSHSSNYYIPIKHNGHLQLMIWALDSGNRNHLEFGYDRIHEDQVEWISYTQKTLTDALGEPIPSIGFLHIPPPEYMDIWPDAKGNRYEDVACPGNHSRYLLSSLPGFIALSAGHDHFNDYEATFQNLSLFYGRKTGYAGVGPEPYFNKGARVFEYHFTNHTLQSWIREETGEVVRHTSRNGIMNKQIVCAESVPSEWLGVAIIIMIGVVGVIVAVGKYRNIGKAERFNL